MATLVKNVRNKNIVEFDKGAFDEWCVYLTRPGLSRYAPRDTEYFNKLRQLGNKHGHQKIYTHFVTFYTPTNKTIDARILSLITNITNSYSNDAEEMDIWFSVIYAGMVAEENKAFAVLRKRIKRLGMYQVLIEGFDAEYAANFSRGRKWRELDILMRQRGF
jgi:hypothetical protein